MRALICLMAGAALATAADLRIADAAMHEDRDAIRSLIKQKADVNAAQGDGMTALHWVAFHDDLESAKLLLAAGANVKAATRDGAITPLFIACNNGNAAMIEALIKAGADAKSATAEGATALMKAAVSGSAAAIDVLIAHGADANAKESAHGQTALMFAAASDRPEAIKALIAHGADWKLTSNIVTLERPTLDDDGNPIPLRPTPKAGDLVGIALAGRRVAPTMMGGMTALLYAARDGNIAAARALVESGADTNQVSASDKSSPMVIAISNAHYELGKMLLDHGADPNVANADGLVPLYAAIDMQWAPVSWVPNAITAQEKVGYLDLMKALLEKGANPNARLGRKLWFRPTSHDQIWIGTAGSTAFWRAALATDVAAMKLLVEHGADPKIATMEETTPLMVAAGVGWAANFTQNAPGSWMDAVRYCLELGLDVNAKDLFGYTAMHGAAYRGDNDMVKLLADRGAKMDGKSRAGYSVTDMANGPKLNAHLPIEHPETVALLVKLGAPGPQAPAAGDPKPARGAGPSAEKR
jgi:ankyrin repeat protein